MAWRPDNRQWIVIAVSFLLGGFTWIVALEAGSRGGDELTGLAVLIAIGGALLVWFLEGKRGTETPSSESPRIATRTALGSLELREESGSTGPAASCCASQTG